MSNLYPENVHLPYDSPELYYHYKAAELATTYTNNEQLSILDCSCGVGSTSKYIKQLKPDCKLTVSDIDPKCLEYTASKVEVENSILISDIADLYQRDESYDVIILSHVLEHLYHPVDAVNGLLNMLTPNGVLILVVPNNVTPLTILGSLLRWHNMNRGHVFAWDRSTWMVFLEDVVKVDVVEHTQDVVPIPYIWTKKIFQPFVKAMTVPFPWFSVSHISVVRQKK